MSAIAPSRHKCLVYEGHPAEQLPVITPFLQQGLSEGRRCLYLGDPDMVRMVEGALRERGVDTDARKRSGALVLSSDRGHLKDGLFDPGAMVDGLRRMVSDAVSEGFTGLCATGDMRWELGTERNFDRLLEYETLLESVFHEMPLEGICQYRREDVPPRALADALTAHRSLFVGGEARPDNLFYVPPEVLRADEDAAARDRRGVWMCQQITRVLRAERRRDEALQALRGSEARQRSLAEELARANQDLELRVRERTAALESANRELEAFSYSVSHDLRAPVRHVQGYVGILREEAAGLTPEDRQTLERIEAASARMSSLIEGLLAFSHAGRVGLRLERAPLAEVVEKAWGDLSLERADREVVWKAAALPEARCDPGLMRQVFVNLLSNALKFTRPRRPAVIEVGPAASPGRAVVYVRDNGVGFRDGGGRLFGVFQRLHPPSEFEGTGVGLANVQRIVRRHGGDVWAESEEGKGATFYVSLPAAQAGTDTVATA